MSAATEPVRESDQMDWAALEIHLRACLDLPARPMTVRQFTAGRANLTYLVRFGDARLVLRRPPRGTLAPGSHDMSREYKVLSKLWASYPPAPRALHFCSDPSVIGAPFLAIEYREGEVFTGSVPLAMAHHKDVGRRMTLALIDTMAALHQVDISQARLNDLGRPEGYAGRQVSGWLDRWHRAAPADDTSAMEEIAVHLARTCPAPQRVSLVHNDLKLDNCQFEAHDPDKVAAVFDWDMATLGDPLFDLANFLVANQGTNLPRLSDGEIMDRYCDRTGMDVSGLEWYVAFARWRSAVVVQQLYNRYVRGESSDERVAEFGMLVPAIAESVRQLLAGR